MVNIKNITITAITLLGLLIPTLVPTAIVGAQANISGGLCAGANLDATDPDCDINSSDTEERINDIIATIINIFSLIVGVVAVIMIIVGGLKYITSGGDSGNITGAKNTILYAVVGLVVVALAQVIVRFVLTNTTPQ